MIIDSYKRDDLFTREPVLHTSGDLLIGFMHSGMNFSGIKSVKVGSRVSYTLLLEVNGVSPVSGNTPYEPFVCNGLEYLYLSS